MGILAKDKVYATQGGITPQIPESGGVIAYRPVITINLWITLIMEVFLVISLIALIVTKFKFSKNKADEKLKIKGGKLWKEDIIN